jgi:hypothetical protein
MTGKVVVGSATSVSRDKKADMPVASGNELKSKISGVGAAREAMTDALLSSAGIVLAAEASVVVIAEALLANTGI